MTKKSWEYLIDLAQALNVNPSKASRKRNLLKKQLRQLWQGRFDNMDTPTRKALTYLSHDYLDQKYEYPVPELDTMVLVGEDHADLASDVVDRFIKDLKPEKGTTRKGRKLLWLNNVWALK